MIDSVEPVQKVEGPQEFGVRHLLLQSNLPEGMRQVRVVRYIISLRSSRTILTLSQNHGRGVIDLTSTPHFRGVSQ